MVKHRLIVKQILAVLNKVRMVTVSLITGGTPFYNPALGQEFPSNLTLEVSLK